MSGISVNVHRPAVVDPHRLDGGTVVVDICPDGDDRKGRVTLFLGGDISTWNDIDTAVRAFFATEAPVLDVEPAELVTEHDVLGPDISVTCEGCGVVSGPVEEMEQQSDGAWLCHPCANYDPYEDERYYYSVAAR